MLVISQGVSQKKVKKEIFFTTISSFDEKKGFTNKTCTARKSQD